MNLDPKMIKIGKRIGHKSPLISENLKLYKNELSSL